MRSKENVIATAPSNDKVLLDMDAAASVGVGKTSHGQVFPVVVPTQSVGHRGQGRARAKGGRQFVRRGQRRQRVVVAEALNLIPTHAP